MIEYLKRLLIGFAFFTHILYAQSNELILIDSLTAYSNLNEYALFCETEIDKLTDSHFFDMMDTNCFVNYQEPIQLDARNYISKISLRYTGERPADMILVFGRSDLMVVSGIVCEGEIVDIKQAGLFFKRSEKDMKDGNMTKLSMTLLPNKTYHIYSHIQKHFSNLDQELNVDLNIFPKGQWEDKMIEKRTFQGIYFGLMLMIIAFGMFFLIQTWRLEYLFYVLFQITSVCNFLILEDFLGMYIFPESPLWRSFLAVSPLLGLGGFYLLFIQFFIDTKKHYSNWNKAFHIISGTSFFIYLLGVLIFKFEPFEYFFGFVIAYVGGCTMLVTFASILFFLDKPSKLRFYLLLGSGILCLGYIVSGYNIKYQVIPLDGAYIIYIASFIESLIFAAGLAYKSGLIEQEKLELEEQKLIIQHEKENLAEIGQLKSRLYTNITHEFRTPLTIILGVSKQLKKRVGESGNNSLEMIHRNGQLLLDLINQMLDLSKLEAGKLELNYIHGDVVNFWKYLTESFQSLAENRAIQLHFLSDLEELFMDYDPERLQQIFFNLISNALKFTSEGGNIYLQIAQQDEGFVILKIRDTGVGIPEEELDKIFDRFYQIDQSNTRKGGGSGIGLALVKELVKLMEGEIQVKSKVGKGTEFSLLLPIRHEFPHTLEDPKEFSIGFTPSLQESSKKVTPFLEAPKVLIIEDNEDVLHYISNSLISHYQIETATDGGEGIQKALKQIPDIIISDVMMPIKDGLEVCEILKEDKRSSHIPIILLTAKADIESKLKGLKYGADMYLSKPFHEEELLLHIHNLLQHRDRLKDHYLFMSGLSSKESKIENEAPEHAFVNQVKMVISKHLSDHTFTVNQLSKEISLSSSQLHRKLKALTGHSAIQLIRMIRLNQAKQMLIDSSLNISEIAYSCGFSDPDYFSKVFKKGYGKSPSEFRNSTLND